MFIKGKKKKFIQKNKIQNFETLGSIRKDSYRFSIRFSFFRKSIIFFQFYKFRN
ncbi:hypothetical protein RIEPE_0547 [Candidatus Riesia pediculicola USDA]|uniref:Uncharacterized protein n=1 Tax=Riesia pediculicola (strain USDA) TaxID=515618 RepID=D4G8X1_RIEPU|nr:hypothetical protein RIEPE_0547 [Candidatus Riesia pediculicola USDA]